MNRLTFWRFFPKIFYSAFIILTGGILSAQAPTISSFTPASGPIGTTVTITGTNFNTTPANNIVWFGAVKATVAAASATELQVTVPTGATYQPITVTTNGLTAYSGATFNITFSSTRIIDATTLASKVDFSAGTNPFHAVITDLDGDGKPDLIFTNQGSNTVSILRNTSTPGFFFGGSFESKWDLACGTYPIGIAVGDIDGDGKPDIAVANFLNNSVSVFRNTSTPGSFGVGSFAAKVDFPTGSNPYAVAIGDIDGDGKPDLSVTNDFSSSVSVLRNTSTSGSIDAGSFAAKVDFTTGTNVRAVIIGDIDIDGKPDLITGSYNDHTFSVLRNTSTPGSIDGSSFAAKVDFPSATSTYAAALGDIDGDDKPDLIFSSINDNTISIYRNTSMPGFITAGSFADRVDFTTGAYPSSISIGDLDGNNKPDIAVTNLHSNTVSLFRNKSTTGSITTSSLAGRIDFSTWTYPSSVAIGDIDGDLKPDITVINSNSNVVSVFRNVIPQPEPPVINSFTPTSGPVGTTVTITGTNFNTSAEENIVWFGAVQAMVTSATSTQLIVTVPTGATYQPITVTVNGVTGYSNKPFNVTFLSTRIIDATTFAAKVDFTSGTAPYYASIGDIDGDGKPDLIVANYSDNNISVYRNTSTSGSILAGSFADKVDFASGSNPYYIAIGELDGDGKPDLVVTNYGSNSISVFRNTSTTGTITAGSFSTKVDFATGVNPQGIAIRDIDEDGKPDLIVVNFASNTVSIFRNTSSLGSLNTGSFAASVDFTTGSYPNSVAVGDIDGDGKPDLAVLNYMDQTVSIFRNTSTSGSINSGSFAVKVDFTTGVLPSDIAIGDVDKDGKPDLVVSSFGNSVSVLRNTCTAGSIGTESFAAKIDFAVGGEASSVAVDDFDGDGKPDLAVVNYNSNSVSILRNISTSGSITAGSFAVKVDFTTGTNPESVAIGDLDGDGKPDFVVANHISNTISVLRNTIPEPVPLVITSFTPTSGPIGTIVTITGTNFSTTAANNIVWFGAVQATVTDATVTQLTVTVPAGAAYQPISVTINGLTAYSNTPFIVTFPGTQVIDAYSFTTKVDLQTGTTPQGVAIGDIDGDGRPDLLVANINGNSISAYRNIGTSGSISAGSFEPRVDFITGMNPNSITLGDLDGDGKQDLIVANGSESSISIYRNTGTSGSFSAGSFDTRINLPAGNNPHDIAVGDIDGDGKPDLVISNFNSSIVTIYRNISTPGSITTGSFALGVDFPAELYLQDIVLADIDGDGKPDLVAPNFYSSTVSVYRNISTTGSITSSSFAAKVEFTTLMNPISIAIGDLDGDGKPEMIVSGNSPINVSVFHNISTPGSLTSGSFDPKIDFSSGGSAYVAIGDINGDGKPDLVFKNGGSSVSVFKNTCTTGSIGTDSFASGIEFPASGGTGEIIVGDLDCDGKLDLVYLEGAGNLVSILRNKISEPIPPAITSITPAYGPIGTAVTITGTNFSTTPANNIVWFGAVQATVTAATATQLTVTVPTGVTYQPITVTVNGLTAFSSSPFTVTFPGTHIIDAAAFTSKVDLTAGASPSNTSISDIDGDGKADLIVTNNGSNTVSVYRNISTSGSLSAGSFAPGIDFSTGTNPSCVAVGDIDGDGKQDIIVTNWGSSTISVFRNTSISGSITNGSFAAKVDFTTGSDPDDIAIGDIDGDGRPDIVVINIISGTVSVFRNTNSPGSITLGSLAARIDFATGSSPTGVAIGDIDGDGKHDIAISNYGSNSVSIFRNISTSGSISAGSFAAKVDFTTGTNPKGVIINDIDGDGKPDLVVLNYSDKTLSVFRNTSISGSITSGSFDTRVDFTTGLNPCSFTISDINGDSKPDMAVINNGDNTISIFGNTSTSGSITSGSFAAKIDFSAGNNPRNVNVGDLDGDGRQDLVITNFNINTVSILHNTISFSIPVPPVITSFTPASGPIGTTVTITGTNFSAIQTDNIVWFGAVKATVTAFTGTQLTVKVPTGTTYQPITVTVNGLTAYSNKPFIVTFPSTQIIDATTLAIKVDFTTEASPNGIAIGDIDGDGKPDLIIANTLSDIVSVYRNISTSGSISAGSFSAKVDFATGAFPHGVAIGDIDGDGKPDLVVTNFTSNTVSVYRNTSTSGSLSAGSFAVRVDLPTGMHPQNVVIGDIDGDGKPDLAVTNNGDDIVSIFRNTTAPGSITAGSFAARVDFPTGTGSGPWGIIIGDIDGDDKPDLVVTNNKSNIISVYRNTSTPGSITLSSKVDITAANPLCIAFGDIDSDSKPDLVVVNVNFNTVSVFRNTSTSGLISFANSVDLATGTNPYCIAISDIDGDSKLDLIITNSNSNTASIYRNTSTSGSISVGSFAAKVDFSTGLTPDDIAIGDIDGDGKPDLVTANSGSYTVSVLRNNISEYTPVPPVITSFTPTSGPVGSVVAIAGTNFSATAANNNVWFGAVKAEVTAASATNLLVTVPTGTTYQPITVTVNGLTAYSGAPFNVTFSGTHIIDATAFAPKVNFPTGMSPHGVAIGDLDSDGKPDLVVVNTGSDAISVFRNSSSPGSIASVSFPSRIDFPAENSSQCIAIGDINGDSKPDLIVTNRNSMSVSVYQNTSISGSITSGSFTAKVNFQTGTNPQGIAIGDIDGDGKPDLAVLNYNSNTVSVLKNTGTFGSISSGSFAAKVDFATGTNPSAIAVGDIDGDGKPDLVIANFSDNTISLLRNISTSGSITTSFFAAKVDLTAITNGNPSDIAIGDIDGDGKPDLVVTNYSSNSISVFRNKSIPGSITSDSFDNSTVAYPAGANPRSIAIGDIDGDGKPDLTITNYTDNTVSVFRNLSTSGQIGVSSLAARVDFTVEVNSIDVAVGDLDCDGKMDIITSGFINNSISVLRNTISESVPPVITSFTPTSGPVGTTVIIEGTNFGTTPEDNIVRFGTVQTAVISVTLTQLTFIVPAGATTQPISVTVNGLTANSSTSFTVTASPSELPTITSFNPASGPVGTSVTIDGTNFSTNISNNIVRFGTVQAAVISATATQLSVIVPAGATNQPIYVTVNELTAYTITSFIVIYAPAITSFTPDSGPVGTTVTIQGENFSTTPADNIVLFGTVQASVAAATATQLTVTVPTGATNQAISITVNGLTANSSTPFTVTEPPPPPVITSFDPTSGQTHWTLTITGNNFSTNPANNIVWFGAVRAQVTAATATELTVTVPAGATYKPITVTVNGLTAYSGMPYNNIFPSLRNIDASTLSQRVDFPTNPGSWSDFTEICDIDGDGKPDLIFGNTGVVSIYRNISTYSSFHTGSLDTRVDLNTGGNVLGIDVGDIDGDGKPDIAFANQNNNTVSIFRNISAPGSLTTGSFDARVDIPAGIRPEDVAIGDIDGDGKPDLAVINYGDGNDPATGTVSVLRNIGSAGFISSGSFTSKVDFQARSQGIKIRISDIDGDRKPDIIITTFSGSQISIFRNISTSGSITLSSLAARVDLNMGLSPYGFDIGDLDGDGKLDLAVLNSLYEGTTVSVYRNTSTSGSITNNSFASKVDFNTGPNPKDVAIGDIDGDGRPDMVVANENWNTISVFKNNSSAGSITTNSFASKVDFTTGSGPGGLAIGDLDADGKPEVVVRSFYDGIISVLRNTTITPNPPVIADINPTSGPVGSTVTINGANFSQNPENNIVMFGDAQATVTGGNQNQITVLVPEGADGQNISVTVYGQTAYSTDTFTVTIPTDIELESAILTLNGDGINERFVFKNFSAYGGSSLYVYNSRGAVVFWNKDFTGEWDLTVNGRRLDTGGYFYVIQTELGTFRGSFSILRR